MKTNIKHFSLILIISITLIICLNNITYAVNIDEEIRRITLENKTDFLDDSMDFFTELGNSKNVIPLLLLIPDKDAKIDTFKSLLISATITQGLKIAIGQKRPPGPKEYIHFTNNGEYQAMPSGHASGAFAVASSLAEHYPKYKIPFYTVATLIAYSRVYKDRHWFSNVVIGAGIGYLSTNIVEITW